MGIIGKIVGSETAVNKDSGRSVVLLIVELSEPDDKQSVENFRLAGIDSKPPQNSHVLVEDAGSFLIVSSVDDNVPQESADGEIEIYASVASLKTSKIKCEASGDVVINDGTKGVAREDHETTVDAVTDAAFVQWMSTVSLGLGGLTGVAITPPITVIGKISEGESTVKIP